MTLQRFRCCCVVGLILCIVNTASAQTTTTCVSCAAGSGDVTDVGDCATGACFTAAGTGNSIVFEGASADAFETTLTAADTTTPNKTITLPNQTGTVLLTTGGQTITDVTTIDPTSGKGLVVVSDGTNNAAEFKDSGGTARTVIDPDGLLLLRTASGRRDSTTGDQDIAENGWRVVEYPEENYDSDTMHSLTCSDGGDSDSDVDCGQIVPGLAGLYTTGCS